MASVLTEKRDSIGRDHATVLREYHWTVENFYQAATVGIFENLVVWN